MMAAPGTLESLQALYSELVAVCDHRFENIQVLEQALDAHVQAFRKLLDKKPRDNKSREAIKIGKIKIQDEEYGTNADFTDAALQLADSIDLDELEAATMLFYAQDDQAIQDRSLVQRGLIRFFRQQLFLLHSMRLCIQISLDEELPDELQAAFAEIVDQNIYGVAIGSNQPPDGMKKFIPHAAESMATIKTFLQQIGDRMIAATVVGQGSTAEEKSFQETLEFMRVTLIEQHEILAFMSTCAIEKRHAEAKDFEASLSVMRKWDKYDQLLVHLMPITGAFITMFGSTDGVNDLQQARKMGDTVRKQGQDATWTLPFVHAAVRAWWFIDFSGWFGEEGPAGADEGIDQVKEQQQRAKQLSNALTDGAFDFLLAAAADVKTPDWQDPARIGIRQWLQRKSPALPSDSTTFSDFFQDCFMTQLESLISGLISYMPDELRLLRTEEDEQRQLSPQHEQDLDLERFCLIIAYAYEGRLEAARDFWEDPESNLAGFLHWASKRASTPLVSAFCEMLHSIACDEFCADAAHAFLQDEGATGSGRMRKTTALTWQTLIRELVFFTNKIRERPSATQTQMYRGGRITSEQAETEPESAMMLECYLRLMTTLAIHSEKAKSFMLKNDANLTEVLCRLASSPTRVPRLRACAFFTIKSFITRKTREESNIMWKFLESWAVGQYLVPLPQSRQLQQSPLDTLHRQLSEAAEGFEEPNAVVQLLTALMAPAEGSSELRDDLPFPEDLGAPVRLPGAEPYVDFVLGQVFANGKDISDANQSRLLRLSCLQFIQTCLASFNEDLIIIGSETSLPVETIMTTTDLATYVRMHPYSRVMEWMFNSQVLNAMMKTIHQDHKEVGNASPDSPLIRSIVHAIEVIIQVLEAQDTYLDLVRPLIRDQNVRKWDSVSNTAYASFEEGITDQADLIVDLGIFCGMGHPGLTLASLRLLERISASSNLSLAGKGQGRNTHRNKAIVALETGEHVKAISEAFIADLMLPVDLGREVESANYSVKVYILNFLDACLRASPDQPTIAHLFLGFGCQASSISVENDGAFESRTSLFHNLLKVLLEIPFGDAERGMRTWMVNLKYGIMRILQLLWSSPLSSSIVLNELRDNDLLFHMLVREVLVEPELPWEGQLMGSPEFWSSEGATTFATFLSIRAMLFEYISIELCAVTQARLLNVKRRLFDALCGQLKGDDGEVIPVSSIFELFDFLPPDGREMEFQRPQLNRYKSLDINTCLTSDEDGNEVYNIERVKQLILLKRSESKTAGAVITEQESASLDKEEVILIEALSLYNKQQRVVSFRLATLQTWTNVLMVMFESNDFSGNAKISFLLQALQSLLPSLEAVGSENPLQAIEIARAARLLLFKSDLGRMPGDVGGSNGRPGGVGNLLGDKLLQLFQICMHAVGKWAGNSELRALYYSIGYKYIVDIADRETGLQPMRQKALKTVHVYGERLLNVICDDAHGGDVECQTSALILLGSLVSLSGVEEDAYVVEALNRLNFIGVLVDSLKSMTREWLEIVRSNNAEQAHLQTSKLSLLLEVAQSRPGAKFIVNANFFRVIETTGLFAVDPDLELDLQNHHAIAKFYALLANVARIVAAIVVSRGAHNVVQGRRFITENRLLVMAVLKRSAGIGSGANGEGVKRGVNGGRDERMEVEEEIARLAEAFMVVMSATQFLEYEEQAAPTPGKAAPMLYH